jgi:hypothetical protein
VLVQNKASVLVEVAKAKAVAGCPTVTELDLEEQSSEVSISSSRQVRN